MSRCQEKPDQHSVYQCYRAIDHITFLSLVPGFIDELMKKSGLDLSI